MKISSLFSIKNNKKGWTLIEVLISIVLITVMISILLNFWIYSYKEHTNTSNSSEVNILLNKSLSRIVYDIEISDYIYSTKNIKELTSQYPENIGFVMEGEWESNSKFTTYVIKEGSLTRLSYSDVKGSQLRGSKIIGQSGHNKIMDNVRFTKENKYSGENKNLVIGLEKKLGDKKIMFNRDIYLGYLREKSYEQ